MKATKGRYVGGGGSIYIYTDIGDIRSRGEASLFTISVCEIILLMMFMLS